MKKRVGFKYKGKEIHLEAIVCNTILKRTRGLMFRRKESSKVLVFPFKKETLTPIHSYFVFFPFLAIWLDKNNKIIEIKRINPFKPIIKTKRPFKTLLEIPINKNYEELSKLLVEN
jgi:uncharacterized membrane protein (UPF0127 family)